MAMSSDLSPYWHQIQSFLFPWMREELCSLGAKHYEIIAVLEMTRIEQGIIEYIGPGRVGRPAKSRRAIARAFVAKAVLNLGSTRQLIDRLQVDLPLRRICGWEQRREIPSESVFSRAFAEFAESQLPVRMHEILVSNVYEERIVGHLSRDATAIAVSEKPVLQKKPEKIQLKKGRPKRGECPPTKELSRLERQKSMTLSEMINDLPKQCNIGRKRNSQGFENSWIGYKLHMDVADGDIPISALLTSASVSDAQVARPLALCSKKKVVNLYDLMDSAYDAKDVREHSLSLGHIPLIDINYRWNFKEKQDALDETNRFSLIHFELPTAVRFRERSSVERVNGNLKENFGGNAIRVKGHQKVFCHLMFGIIALTSHCLMRLVN